MLEAGGGGDPRGATTLWQAVVSSVDCGRENVQPCCDELLAGSEGSTTPGPLHQFQLHETTPAVCLANSGSPPCAANENMGVCRRERERERKEEISPLFFFPLKPLFLSLAFEDIHRIKRKPDRVAWRKASSLHGDRE